MAMKKSKKASKNITKNTKFTGKTRVYMQWPLWMTFFLALGCIGMFTISIKAGFFMVILTALYALVAWLLCAGSQKDVLGEFVTFAAHYGQIQSV